MKIQKENILMAGWVVLLSYGMYTVAIALTLRAFDPITAFFVYAQEYGLWFAVILYIFPFFIAYKALTDESVRNVPVRRVKKHTSLMVKRR